MSEHEATIKAMEDRLTAAFHPTHLIIEDDSEAHLGHPGNQGGGHFILTLRAPAFEGVPRLQAHRMIYDALGDLMGSAIHALTIKTK